MIKSIRLSAKALAGYFRREVVRERALPWPRVLVRALWLMGQCRAHARVLGRGESASPLLTDDYFRVLSRPTLPYLSTSFNWATWRDLHADHCVFVADRLGAKLYERVVADGLLIWQGQERAADVSIHLGGPCPHREGGLTLVLKLAGEPIYRLAFSLVRFERFLPHDSGLNRGPGIYVGQIQGYPGCFEKIKQVTTACKDIAPPDLLVSALLGLASALGIQQVKAVTLEYCPSYKKMLAMGHCFNYQQFWGGRWGASFDGTHHHLELPVAEKPLSEVKANHRGRTLAKRRFKHGVADTVAACLWEAMPASIAVRPRLQPYTTADQGCGGTGSPAASVTACASGRQIGSRTLQTMAP
ncbi:MAG: hypothetical protein RI907_2820 [Pseudomonadota bacterium]|jgi:uncharacterized protein VirK/YbjX